MSETPDGIDAAELDDVAPPTDMRPDGPSACARSESRTRSFGSARVVDVDVSPRHTCAVLDTGRVRCWGDGSGWRLTGGDHFSAPDPVEVVGLDSAVDVAVGPEVGCALLDDNTVTCWGYTRWHQPTTVEDVDDVVALTDRCALQSDGALWCWSWGLTPANGNAPESAEEVSGGRNSGCVLAGPDVHCWNSDSLSGWEPKWDHIRLETAATAVTGSFVNGCAVLATGRVACWQNDQHTNVSVRPRSISGISDAIDVALSDDHGCALHDDGSVSCWGANDHGQLGDGTLIDRAEPVRVEELDDAISIEVATGRSCAVLSAGNLRCWGLSSKAQAGAACLSDVETVALSSNYGCCNNYLDCATRADGTVACWTASWNGPGLQGDGFSPPVDIPLPDRASTVATDGLTACAILANGRVACWRDRFVFSELSRLLYPLDPPQHEAPPHVVNDIREATFIGMEGRAFGIEGRACAVSQDGSLSCFVPYHDEATPETIFEGGIQQVVGDDQNGCALSTDGKVLCWGRGEEGQLGNGEFTRSDAPVEVDGVDDALAVDGDQFRCALRSNGAVDCWGDGYYGDGDDRRSSPVPVSIPGLPPATEISVSGTHACIRDEAGSVWCWGGIGGSWFDHHEPTPLRLPQLDKARQISVSAEHGCALLDSGELRCWGVRGPESAQCGIICD